MKYKYSSYYLFAFFESSTRASASFRLVTLHHLQRFYLDEFFSFEVMLGLECKMETVITSEIFDNNLKLQFHFLHFTWSKKGIALKWAKCLP